MKIRNEKSCQLLRNIGIEVLLKWVLRSVRRHCWGNLLLSREVKTFVIFDGSSYHNFSIWAVITNNTKRPRKSIHTSFRRRRVTTLPPIPPKSPIHKKHQLTKTCAYLIIGDIDEVLGNETTNSLEGSVSPNQINNSLLNILQKSPIHKMRCPKLGWPSLPLRSPQ